MNLQSYKNTILILLFAIFLVCLFFLRTTTDPVLFLDSNLHLRRHSLHQL